MAVPSSGLPVPPAGPAAAGTAAAGASSAGASLVGTVSASTESAEPEDAGQLDLEDRHALRRVAGLSTELQDITEVEYRALRLERVVLMGVWTHGTLATAENSLRELPRPAQTAGSPV